MKSLDIVKETHAENSGLKIAMFFALLLEVWPLCLDLTSLHFTSRARCSIISDPLLLLDSVSREFSPRFR